MRKFFIKIPIYAIYLFISLIFIIEVGGAIFVEFFYNLFKFYRNKSIIFYFVFIIKIDTAFRIRLF